MTLHAFLFYLVGLLVLGTTAVAVTRQHMVHAVLYLVVSFFGSAVLFYLLGAPLLAVLEIIIYAGAIMILFLFIVMMLRVEEPQGGLLPHGRWLPAAGIGGVYLAVVALAAVSEPDGGAPLMTAVATPRAFGSYVFTHHWLAIEIVSLLLLVILFGILHLGKGENRGQEEAGK
jgi:NADH-quinone oxidoreductase subunit J